eukprot:SAG31_NODE_766_length_12239_cov_16.248435_3_plen_95_part_00
MIVTPHCDTTSDCDTTLPKTTAWRYLSTDLVYEFTAGNYRQALHVVGSVLERAETTMLGGRPGVNPDADGVSGGVGPGRSLPPFLDRRDGYREQ